MAERIQVELVDDIDGSPAQHTVTFALDGVTYEIDLNERHAQQLRSLLARYIERSRPTEDRVSRTAKQQEREERNARQANRQLTEQIRGAAQRTREHHKKNQPAEAPGAAEQVEEEQQDFAQPLQAEQLAQEKPQQDKAEQEQTRVPAVSLPQFSSAVD